MKSYYPKDFLWQRHRRQPAGRCLERGRKGHVGSRCRPFQTEHLGRRLQIAMARFIGGHRHREGDR